MRLIWSATGPIGAVGRWAAAAILAIGMVVPAHAADKPMIGPAPAWIKPMAPAAVDPKRSAGDDAASTTGGGENGAAVRLLVSDQQVRLDPGRVSVYTASIFRVQTPDGLSAGNVDFAWQPDTDDVTVHKLLIHHGDGSTVDVLASGQTFTVVRRETNLENAALDGVLTATLQPEGLQVGDVVELAMTISSSDPVLKGHVEFIGATWDLLPVDRAHLAIAWAPAIPVRVQPSAALPTPKISHGDVHKGVSGGLDILLDKIEPLPPPKDAPARFRIGRLLELTDFASWADLSALLAPLYDKAGMMPAKGPLADEAAKIKAASADPIVRAQLALRLVEDRVRYVALLMGPGAWTPADAETSWSRRFGDCKAKTALLLALLRDMGISADPVLVNAYGVDGLDQRLPMLGLFNHVVVRAEIAGKTYWLDGTRTGDRRLDQLEIPNLGWGLPLVKSGGALVRLVPPPYEKPTEVTTIRIDAHDGITLPAPTIADTSITGDTAYVTSLNVDNLAPDARDRALREYWKKQYDFIDVKSASFTYDADKREAHFHMEGDARMEWKDGWYETDGTGVGYQADFSRDPGPDKDAPFVVPYPFFSRNIETIILPEGFHNLAESPKQQVNETAGGIEYRRTVTTNGTTFHIETSQRSVVSEISAKDAPAAQVALRALADRQIYLRRPDNYQHTEKEITALVSKQPSSLEEYLGRAWAFLYRDQPQAALADFAQALKLDPKNAYALSGRALAHALLNQASEATADADASLKLDPHQSIPFRARGLVAESQGKYADAVTAYTNSLEIEPDHAYTVRRRAISYRQLGDNAKALADADRGIKLAPADADVYLLKASIQMQDGDVEGATATATALAEANPKQSYAAVAAGRIFDRVGKPALAMKQYDRALAIKPEAYIYINRASSRPRADLVGRRADLDAALALEPKLPNALIAKADLESEAGNFGVAATLASTVLADQPNNIWLMAKRGVAYVRAGQKDKGDRDFTVARTKATDAMDLNNICFVKAEAGLALDRALAECDAAIAKEPALANIRDSRGMVLLRLGRLDEAIADYDLAIAKEPRSANALLGRAMAWAKKGDKAKAAVDRAAALKIDPRIEDVFAGYGLKLPQ